MAEQKQSNQIKTHERLNSCKASHPSCRPQQILSSLDSNYPVGYIEITPSEMER